MKNVLKRTFFGKKALQPLFRRLFDISIEGMNIGTGGRHPSENGELFAARYALSKETVPTVFDVGAQGGDYIEAILATTQDARIYAFEPCLKDYQILAERFAGTATIVQSALGDSEGEVTLYYPDTVSGLSSLYKQSEKFNRSERVPIQTIDSFCKSNGVKDITLLKLDVEGNELACLKGAKQMLPNIRYIQFEVSTASRDSRTYFRDIFEYLSDYTIYRILRDGFYEIKEPERITELLFTTNFFAERKSS